MSLNLFKNFDFNLLDSANFKEDSVREELITPLLHALGSICQNWSTEKKD